MRVSKGSLLVLKENKLNGKYILEGATCIGIMVIKKNKIIRLNCCENVCDISVTIGY